IPDNWDSRINGHDDGKQLEPISIVGPKKRFKGPITLKLDTVKSQYHQFAGHYNFRLLRATKFAADRVPVHGHRTLGPGDLPKGSLKATADANNATASYPLTEPSQIHGALSLFEEVRG